MILFQPYHVPPTLSGRKTQTRRVLRQCCRCDRQPRCRVKAGSEHWAQTRLFKPASRFARLDILAVRPEELGRISAEDVYAEGYDTRDDFIDAFDSINGALDLSQPVWVVTFRMVAFGCGCRPRPAGLLVCPKHVAEAFDRHFDIGASNPGRGQSRGKG